MYRPQQLLHAVRGTHGTRSYNKGYYMYRNNSIFPRTINVAESMWQYGEGGLPPIHLRDVLADRYVVLRKLGYGSYATVWLAKDMITGHRVALKAAMSDYYALSLREAQVLRRMHDTGDQASIIRMINSFDHSSRNGRHHILILEPMGRTLAELITWSGWSAYDRSTNLKTRTVRALVRKMVAAVAYVHAAGTLHGDISVSNFMFRHRSRPLSEDCQQMETVIKEHQENYSLSRSHRDDTHVGPCYPSYLLEPQPLCECPEELTAEALVLADFGSSSLIRDHGDQSHTYPIDVRAPEIILGRPATTASDIWALGCAIFHTVTLVPLFNVDNFATGERQADEYLACIIDTLGAMPHSLLTQWQNRARYLDKDGSPLVDDDDGPWAWPLRETIDERRPVDMSQGDVDSFETLIRWICNWQVEERATAAQILEHEWLREE